MDFLNKVVVVTGGGQGIGRAVARAFAKKWASVVIADCDSEAGTENLTYIIKNGGKGLFIETDVSREESVRQMVGETIARFGGVDILVNNAGVSYKGNIFTDSIAEWDRVLGVNLRGAFLCAKLAVPYMKEAGGAIINIASTRALMSEPDSEAYAASKGGLLALTHALAVSLGPYRIRVNAISPGWIEVGNWQKSSDAMEPVHSEADKSQHPAGRVGRPEDIAEACLYLTSETASFITGANFVIDGGMTKKMIYVE